jgi:hypothetical protein
MQRNNQMTASLQKSARSAVIAFAAVLTLGGCTPQMPETHRDELVGTWTYSEAASTVGTSVPEAKIQLNADKTASVSDFPVYALTEDELDESPLSSNGTWTFQPEIVDAPSKYEKQSGIELLLDQPASHGGIKVARGLAIEKDNGQIRLVIYIQYPDMLDKNYVLTKKS